MEISDRIVVYYRGTPGIDKAIREYKDYIMVETLCTELYKVDEFGDFENNVINGKFIRIG